MVQPPPQVSFTGLLYLNPELPAHSNLLTVEQAILSYGGLSGLPYAVPPLPRGFDARVYLASQPDVSGINATIRAAMVAEGISPAAAERRGVYVGTIMEPVAWVEPNRFALPPGSRVSFSPSNLRVGDEVKMLRARGDPLFGRVTAVDPGGFTLCNAVYAFPGTGGAYTLFGIKVYDPERQARVLLARNGGIAQPPSEDAVPRPDFEPHMYQAVYPDTRGFSFPDTYLDYRTRWRRDAEYRIIKGRDIFNLSAPYTSNLLFAAQNAPQFAVEGDFYAGGGNLTVTASNAWLGGLSVSPGSVSVYGGASARFGSNEATLCSNLVVLPDAAALRSGITAAGSNLVLTPTELRVAGSNLVVQPGVVSVADGCLVVSSSNADVRGDFLVSAGGTVGLGMSNPRPGPEGGGPRLAIDGDVFTTGTVITQSDARAKVDVRRIDDPLDRVSKMCGYTFAARASGAGRRHTGLLAQEVAQAIPEAVYKGAGDLSSVAYGNLAGLLVEAVNALATKVAELERRLTTPVDG